MKIDRHELKKPDLINHRCLHRNGSGHRCTLKLKHKGLCTAFGQAWNSKLILRELVDHK